MRTILLAIQRADSSPAQWREEARTLFLYARGDFAGWRVASLIEISLADDDVFSTCCSFKAEEC